MMQRSAKMTNASTGYVLVVEDDAAIRNLVTTALKLHDLAYDVAENGSQALLKAVSRTPDVIVLDLGLPDMDGVEIIRNVRSWSEVPIIVVSARQEDADKVGALDAGADDYLTKPFSVDEFLARIRVALRRSTAAKGVGSLACADEAPRYRNGGLAIDYAAGCVCVDDKEIHLTPIEFKLLCLLARNTGKVLTHTYILKEVWGQALASDLPSLRVFMTTLRKKIEPDPAHPIYIQTHVGVGYRMLRVEA